MNRPIREVVAQLKRLRESMLRNPEYISGYEAESLNGLSSKALVDTAIIMFNRVADANEKIRTDGNSLRQQRDDLLAALEALKDSACIALRTNKRLPGGESLHEHVLVARAAIAKARGNSTAGTNG